MLALRIIADAIVVIVTWRKTYHTIVLARQADTRTPMSEILLREGELRWLPSAYAEVRYILIHTMTTGLIYFG